jgi:acetoin utilization protein AcuB
MTLMPHTIDHDKTVGDAKALMIKHSCHHLPVLNGGALIGIISETDLKRVERLDNNLKFKIEHVMTEEPHVVKPSEDVFQVAMLMYQKKIGSVIVSSGDDHPWGIFTSTDAIGYFSKKES